MTMENFSGTRKLLLAFGVFLAIFLLVAAWLLGTAWYRVPHYSIEIDVEPAAPILGLEDYAALINRHARPYVYEYPDMITRSGGAVLIFGAEHTRDPENPQISEIEKRWESFAPTVALVESDLGMMFPAFMDPVETFGEVGIVHALAREEGIPTYTWEPPDSALVSSLIEQGFSARQVAARVMLGPYFSSLRHGRPQNPGQFVEGFRNARIHWQGLEGTFNSVAEIDTQWREWFPDGPNWREVSDQYGLPGFLDRMDANRARDEHFVRVILDLVRKGERVFAVCGSSHAVKIEPALRAEEFLP